MKSKKWAFRQANLTISHRPLSPFPPDPRDNPQAEAFWGVFLGDF